MKITIINGEKSETEQPFGIALAGEPARPAHRT